MIAPSPVGCCLSGRDLPSVGDPGPTERRKSRLRYLSEGDPACRLPVRGRPTRRVEMTAILLVPSQERQSGTLVENIEGETSYRFGKLLESFHFLI